ncbi:MAG: hypothetical protein ACI9N1_003166 [Flavobacteriales bacterium]|jgi:uncharacterized protein YdhG (YjbR/CyaY superfamily)
MTIKAETVEEYFENLPEDRKAAMNQLRKTVLANVSDGIAEELSYGMPGYVVPKSVYPAGYHCKPNPALPFISIASQKNFIAFYHMGMYASPELLDWFAVEYPKHSKRKLDMGKSCIRFKKIEEIPYELLGELCAKMSSQEWIEIYEANFKK